jgi:hypothetical protein
MRMALFIEEERAGLRTATLPGLRSGNRCIASMVIGDAAVWQSHAESRVAAAYVSPTISSPTVRSHRSRPQHQG